jgi:hypothetical protein
MTTSKQTTTVVIGNTEITKLVASARSKWASGSKDRFELGQVFSELRAAVDKYTRTSKDTNKVSYAEAVRLTGTPLGTAELYRQMYDIRKDNDILPDVFVILSEAGFNLARDLNDESLPAGIFADKPDLKSVEYLLGLSKEDTKKLIEELHKGYGKEEAQPVSISALKSEVDRMKATLSESKDEDFKSYLQNQIKEKTKTMHSKMVIAMSGLAKAVAVLLGKEEDWADSYIDETKKSGSLTEQRYQEAVKFAESFTVKKPAANGKKAAGSVKSSKKETKQP